MNLYEKTFDILQFLTDNQDEIIKEIKDDVLQFTENQGDFKDELAVIYSNARIDFILDRLKDVILDHFTELNIEQINLILDKEVMVMLYEDEYFLIDNYLEDI
jgi:hypothetical protein